MKYEIKGGGLPYVEIELENGEGIKCEGGGMSWMSPNLEMETSSGGLGKMFQRAVSGERLFQNTYIARGGSGYISIAAGFPGSIIAAEVTPGHDLVCQKSAFLASTLDVDLSVFFQKKIGAGLVGGEGFIMQRLSGNGLVFIEVDGSAEERVLAPGESIVVDTGNLAMCDATCSIDVVAISGVRNALFGGEGLFNTVVSGPGKIVLQSMPIFKMAQALTPFITVNSR